MGEDVTKPERQRQSHRVTSWSYYSTHGLVKTAVCTHISCLGSQTFEDKDLRGKTDSLRTTALVCFHNL